MIEIPVIFGNSSPENVPWETFLQGVLNNIIPERFSELFEETFSTEPFPEVCEERFSTEPISKCVKRLSTEPLGRNGWHGTFCKCHEKSFLRNLRYGTFFTNS
jgi:hypothetical protein